MKQKNLIYNNEKVTKTGLQIQKNSGTKKDRKWEGIN